MAALPWVPACGIAVPEEADQGFLQGGGDMHRAAVAHYGPSACIEGRDQGAEVARRKRQQRTAPHRLRDALRERIVARMRWVICLARRPQK